LTLFNVGVFILAAQPGVSRKKSGDGKDRPQKSESLFLSTLKKNTPIFTLFNMGVFILATQPGVSRKKCDDGRNREKG